MIDKYNEYNFHTKNTFAYDVIFFFSNFDAFIVCFNDVALQHDLNDILNLMVTRSYACEILGEELLEPLYKVKY